GPFLGPLPPRFLLTVPPRLLPWRNRICFLNQVLVMLRTRFLLLTMMLLTIGWQFLRAAQPADVSYYRDVRPIFQQHCQGCHQPAKAQGGYVMTSHAALLKKGESDQHGVVPGKPDESMIVFQITPQNGN